MQLGADKKTSKIMLAFSVIGYFLYLHIIINTTHTTAGPHAQIKPT